MGGGAAGGGAARSAARRGARHGSSARTFSRVGVRSYSRTKVSTIAASVGSPLGPRAAAFAAALLLIASAWERWDRRCRPRGRDRPDDRVFRFAARAAAAADVAARSPLADGAPWPPLCCSLSLQLAVVIKFYPKEH